MLTFHYTFNIGANLQCYALNSYINKNICPCEIIDFYPFKKRKTTLIHKIYHLFKRFFTRERKFCSFRKKYYLLGTKKFYVDNDVSVLNNLYDMFVSGSDQILNINLTNASSVYYLSFVENKKRISYASSFGKSNLNDVEKLYTSKYLSKFNNLSCREYDGSEQVSLILGEKNKPIVVVDPVFLLSKKEWTNLIKTKIKSKKYVFIYLMEDNIYVRNIIDFFSLKHFSIYLVKGSKFTIDGEEKCRIINNCGPLDFLYYIKNSSYVVTNSFHGLAFSIIFDKKLIALRHSTRNCRLETMLNIIGEKDNFYNNLHNVDHYVIDSSKRNGDLELKIQDSKRYLLDSINQ